MKSWIVCFEKNDKTTIPFPFSRCSTVSCFYSVQCCYTIVLQFLHSCSSLVIFLIKVKGTFGYLHGNAVFPSDEGIPCSRWRVEPWLLWCDGKFDGKTVWTKLFPPCMNSCQWKRKSIFLVFWLAKRALKWSLVTNKKQWSPMSSVLGLGSFQYMLHLDKWIVQSSI